MFGILVPMNNFIDMDKNEKQVSSPRSESVITGHYNVTVCSPENVTTGHCNIATDQYSPMMIRLMDYLIRRKSPNLPSDI